MRSGEANGVAENGRKENVEAAGSNGLRRMASHALLDFNSDEEILLSPKQISFHEGSPDLQYSYGSCSEQGQRTHMEDRMMVVDLTGHSEFKSCSRAVLMAVFDGHAGFESAEHLRKHFLDHFLKSHHLPERMWGQALRFALLQCEDELIAGHYSSGSTALVALMVDGGLHLANVGDCRAVVCDDGEARALTRDHKPASNTMEKARLETAGAQVSADGYLKLTTCFGECADIMLSRALGGAPIKSTASFSASAVLTASASSASLVSHLQRGSSVLGPGLYASPSVGNLSGPRHTPSYKNSPCTSRVPSAGQIILTERERPDRREWDKALPGPPSAPDPAGPLSSTCSTLSTRSSGSPAVQGPPWPQLSPRSSGSPAVQGPPRPPLSPRSSGSTAVLGPPKSPLRVSILENSRTVSGSSTLPSRSPRESSDSLNPDGCAETPVMNGSDLDLLGGNGGAAPIIIPDPDLFQYAIHEDSEFVILASDGVWDTVRNSEAVIRVRRWLVEGEIVEQVAALIVRNSEAVIRVRRCLAEGETPEKAAALLVKYAFAMKSQDNTTAVVLRFSCRALPLSACSTNSALRRCSSTAGSAPLARSMATQSNSEPKAAAGCSLSEAAQETKGGEERGAVPKWAPSRPLSSFPSDEPSHSSNGNGRAVPKWAPSRPLASCSFEGPSTSADGSESAVPTPSRRLTSCPSDEPSHSSNENGSAVLKWAPSRPLTSFPSDEPSHSSNGNGSAIPTSSRPLTSFPSDEPSHSSNGSGSAVPKWAPSRPLTSFHSDEPSHSSNANESAVPKWAPSRPLTSFPSDEPSHSCNGSGSTVPKWALSRSLVSCSFEGPSTSADGSESAVPAPSRCLTSCPSDEPSHSSIGSGSTVPKWAPSRTLTSFPSDEPSHSSNGNGSAVTFKEPSISADGSESAVPNPSRPLTSCPSDELSHSSNRNGSAVPKWAPSRPLARCPFEEHSTSADGSESAVPTPSRPFTSFPSDEPSHSSNANESAVPKGTPSGPLASYSSDEPCHSSSHPTNSTYLGHSNSQPTTSACLGGQAEEVSSQPTTSACLGGQGKEESSQSTVSACLGGQGKEGGQGGRKGSPAGSRSQAKVAVVVVAKDIALHPQDGSSGSTSFPSESETSCSETDGDGQALASNAYLANRVDKADDSLDSYHAKVGSSGDSLGACSNGGCGAPDGVHGPTHNIQVGMN
eukprot:gene1815-33234_t